VTGPLIGACATPGSATPAGELLRLSGDRAAELHDTVRTALRDGLAELAGREGVRGRASTWIVTARPIQQEGIR
jgi:hypothetical protein